MSSRWDVARYHKPLSVCIFGGGTLALLVGALMSLSAGSHGLAVGLGLAFLVMGVLVSLYFLDMFVWEPRRSGQVQSGRLQEFLTSQRHQRDRVRQRERGKRR